MEVLSAIEKLRSMRRRFLIDPPLDALINEIDFHELIEPLNLIQKGIGSEDKFYRRISDPKASARDEMTSITLYRLRYNDFDHAKLDTLAQQQRDGTFALTAEQNADLRAIHQRGAEQLFEDGYTARERRVISMVDPDFSFAANPKFGSETHALNESFNPRQHAANHKMRMKVVEANKHGKRPRSAIKKEILDVMRGRKYWRPHHLFTACEAMDELVDILAVLNAQSDTDPEYAHLKAKYRFSDLVSTDSKYAATTEEARLAAAILSAEPTAKLSGKYVPNPTVALSALMHFGVFEAAKAKAKKNSSYSKSLILRYFIDFYPRAI